MCSLKHVFIKKRQKFWKKLAKVDFLVKVALFACHLTKINFCLGIFQAVSLDFKYIFYRCMEPLEQLFSKKKTLDSCFWKEVSLKK